MSLLSWERGLKYALGYEVPKISESLLSWERGLKYTALHLQCRCISRSSRGSVD